MLKGIDDFIILLIIAFVVLGALLAISWITPFGTVDNVTLAQYSLGSIGFISNLPSKTLDIGDIAVGATHREILRSVPDVEVTASVLGGEKKEYTIDIPLPKLEQARDVRIYLTVKNTNHYGMLVVSWNGREVYKNFARNTVTVRVEPENIKASNILRVYTEGPGLLFWAASVYKLSDLKAEIGYGPIKIYVFELDKNELTSFNKGVIDFYGRGQGDRLIITLNGIDLYRKVPSGLTTVEFNYTTAPLKVGENLLAFNVPNGQFELLGTKLNIFLFGKEAVSHRVFNVTKEQLQLLKQGFYRGRIDIQFNKIATPGTFKIGINNQLLALPSLREGFNSIFFNTEDVREGENKIVFSGTGSFDVDWARIVLVR